MSKIVAALLLFFPFLVAAGNAEPGRVTALAKLEKAAPGFEWDPESGLKVDVNSDGLPDYVFLSQTLRMATVGVVIANRRHPIIKSIPIGDPAQDSICGSPASIEIEPLDYEPDADAPGFTRSNTGTSFGLGGGECDVFHFYWDAQKQDMSWWRL